MIGIYFTAKKTCPVTLSLHRLLGNMMLKGCVAVPASRFAGAALQLFGKPYWNEVSGFYQGITGTSLIVCLWETYDLYVWYSRYSKGELTRPTEPLNEKLVKQH
jgi:hypothetical protein